MKFSLEKFPANSINCFFKVTVRNTIKLLDNFSQISGLKVNYSKSELAPLGRFRMEIYTHNFSTGTEMTLDKIKVLGAFPNKVKLLVLQECTISLFFVSFLQNLTL
jgi:hypothetical protein